MKFDANYFRENGTKAKASKSDVSLAFASLKIGIKKYCESYLSLRNESIYLNKDIDISPLYFEHYAEVILHFQHFFELLVKDVLRSENEVYALSLNSDQSFEIIANLANGMKTHDFDIEKIKSIEFSEAFSRLSKIPACGNPEKELIRQCLIKKHNGDIIRFLNELRNKTMHRGIFFLKSEHLDEYVCKHLLPVIIELKNTRYFAGIETYLPSTLANDIDVIEEMVNLYKENAVSKNKLKLLKEMGRASYNSPIGEYLKMYKQELSDKKNIATIDGKEIRLASMSREMIAEIAKEGIGKANYISEKTMADIYQCPVCDQMAMIMNFIECEHETGSYEINVGTHCQVCSFEIHNDIKFAHGEAPYGMPNCMF